MSRIDTLILFSVGNVFSSILDIDPCMQIRMKWSADCWLFSISPVCLILERDTSPAQWRFFCEQLHGEAHLLFNDPLDEHPVHCPPKVFRQKSVSYPLGLVHWRTNYKSESSSILFCLFKFLGTLCLSSPSILNQSMSGVTFSFSPPVSVLVLIKSLFVTSSLIWPETDAQQVSMFDREVAHASNPSRVRCQEQKRASLLAWSGEEGVAWSKQEIN